MASEGANLQLKKTQLCKMNLHEGEIMSQNEILVGLIWPRNTSLQNIGIIFSQSLPFSSGESYAQDEQLLSLDAWRMSARPSAFASNGNS